MKKYLINFTIWIWIYNILNMLGLIKPSIIHAKIYIIMCNLIFIIILLYKMHKLTKLEFKGTFYKINVEKYKKFCQENDKKIEDEILNCDFICIFKVKNGFGQGIIIKNNIEVAQIEVMLDLLDEIKRFEK